MRTAFRISDKSLALQARLQAFMEAHIYPNESLWHQQIDLPADAPWVAPPMLATLKDQAREQGLWNLFLPDAEHGAGLTNLDYAPLAEIMGRVSWAPEVFNCSAPDTGNMELIAQYGSAEQKRRWLPGLLDGSLRSCYLMTEPDVASSDATNVALSIRRDGDSYVLNGRKWFITGAMNPVAKLWIVMGKSDPNAAPHLQQSQIIVERGTPGIRIERPLPVLGNMDRPYGHAEVSFTDVRVPAGNLILGEGRGFEIAQGRLGPGRIHHCMRTIGLAERAIELMCDRLLNRSTFGSRLSENAHWQQKVAEARTEIDMCRLLTLNAAAMMDAYGNKQARSEIAQIKVAVPRMARRVIDQTIQAFGAAGLTDDFRLPEMYATARWISIADGPDEVHNRTIAKIEFKKRNRG